jgi:hypothetical protein
LLIVGLDTSGEGIVDNFLDDSLQDRGRERCGFLGFALNRGPLKLVPLTLDLMGFRDVAVVLKRAASAGWPSLIS